MPCSGPEPLACVRHHAGLRGQRRQLLAEGRDDDQRAALDRLADDPGDVLEQRHAVPVEPRLRAPHPLRAPSGQHNAAARI